ncbi:23S rRNA (uracil(1939)-C(5))-methyltransferase RlmD [Orbus sturtevantii]|uniref:23S rRNA (uracil(1939)-C(5))-methyltransferase RlmD n=1 Tax=Orbus sturtevantii TaxID=3074109 RepID=UPI00370D3C96
MVLFYSPPKKAPSTPKAIKLTVHALDGFGQGIAHYLGKTVFIKNALPGEQVEVRLTEDKRQYAKAKVLKYLVKSEQRIAPNCRHYRICGGCEMQHMAIAMQHHVKAGALLGLIEKETGYKIDATDVKMITSTPYHYRRRARLAIMYENNQLVIGFRQLESKQIVDITVCPVLVEQLELQLVPLKGCLNGLKDRKALGHLDLIHTDSGTIVVLRHVRAFSEQDTKQLVDFALQQKISFYLHGDELVHLVGNKEHYYCIGPLKLMFSPLDFIQVNEGVNLLMIEQAIDWLELIPQDHVLDLFCGMGNFTLPIAMKCANVFGVEGVDALVDKAKFNAIFNRQYLLGDSEFFVSNLDHIDENSVWFTASINKVLLDPARPGANKVIAKIIQYSPTHVVYISCNPATLVRDSKILLQAGYQIANISILDMFPQTKHIESMLLFIKLGTK